MLGRKKKRNESVDLLNFSNQGSLNAGTSNTSTSSTSTPSIAITKASNNSSSSSGGGVNYWVERALGFTGVNNRTRTVSEDGAVTQRRGSASSTTGKGIEILSSSPTGSMKNFFGRNHSSENNNKSHNNHKSSNSLGGSNGSLNEFGSSNSKSGGSFFSRATTTSLGQRPSWFGESKGKNTVTPFTASPSSPVLSLDAAVGDKPQGNRSNGICMDDSSRRFAAFTGSQTDLNDTVKFTSKKSFSRSVDELSRFPSSSEVEPTKSNQFEVPRNSNLDPIRKSNSQTLTPTYTSSSNTSTSAPSNSSLNRNANTFRYGAQNPSTSPLPFPTSLSTPNLSPSNQHTGLDDRRRDSQTIICQGFLQRKGDYAPPAISPSQNSNSINPSSGLKHTKSEIDLQKGWKPYRVVLKGSKLYLHKLPGDLTNTAKQLFPTTIVAPLTSTSELPVPKTADKKPKRAFWGTGATHHPDLIVGSKGKQKESVVQGGTLEALIHELIFASSFVEFGEDRTSYDLFLEILLLIWPFLPFSSSLSASELDRCSGLAVRTAVELSSKNPEGSKLSTLALASRLEKIVEIICLRFPEDLKTSTGSASDWKLALGELVKQLDSLPSEESSRASSILENAFNQSIPSRSIPPTEWTLSRPNYSRAGSSASTTSTSPSKPRKQTGLEQEFPSPSISASTFLACNPTNFAAQINLFHLNRLKAISGQTSSSRHILRAAATVLSGSKQNPITFLFSFSPSRPHFLSRMVLETIFDTSITSSNSSSAEIRASIITHWISVGEESRSKGDISAWMAIAFALCCRAVARLEETWRSIEEELVDLVRREWAPVLAGLGFVDFEQCSISPLGVGVNRKGGIPYFGSIVETTVDALRTTKTSPSPENSGAIDLLPFYQLKIKLDHLNSIWNQEEEEVQVPLEITPNVDLQYFFQTLSRQLPPVVGSQLRSYLTNSLEAEPRFAGAYPSLFGKVRSSIEPSPLLPLIMVEPLPYLSLIDREKVIAMAARSLPRKQSNSNMSSTSIPAKKSFTSLSTTSSTGTTTPDHSRTLNRHNSYPPSTSPSIERIGFAKALRSEIANPSETLLRFAEGDLVFRIVVSAALPVVLTQIDGSNKRGLLSRTSSWIESKSSRGTPKGGSIHESIGVTGAPISRRGSRSFSTHSIELVSSPRLQPALESEPVSVVVKAGTIDSLLDILTFGIDKLRTPTTDANGEISLAGGRPLTLDVEEFRNCFFATYRSFSTPLALLDMLRKRYLSAPNASQDCLTLSATKPFPNWSSPSTINETTSDLDRNQVSLIRFAVLENLRYWFENHLSDFLDDDDLYSSTHAFFLSVELIEEANVLERPQDYLLLEEIKNLKQRFYRKCLRPLVQCRKNVEGGGSLARSAGSKSLDLSFDLLSVTDLVDKLDGMACTITQDVTANDLLRYAELMEMASLADPTAFYSSKLLNKVDDEDVVLTDPYSHLRTIGFDPTFVKRMPASLQFGLKVHTILRRWILCHIIDPELSVGQRKHRILKALDIVEVLRSRMSGVLFGGAAEVQNAIQDPSLASFVERAVISAILSPESRAYASAWNGVQLSRSSNSCDTLAGLLQSNLFVTDKTACLDLAWLNERLLEIGTQVENYSERASINFDKRRWIFNCIKNVLAIQPSQAITSFDDNTLEQMERKLTGWGNWGSRTLREVATSEGTRSTRSIKPFSRLVAQQQEKLKRDRLAKEFVAKGLKLEQQSRIQKEKDAAKSLDKTRTKRMTAIFSRTVRPISTNTGIYTSAISPSPDSLRNLNEWIPAVKPYLVLALSGVDVNPVQNAQRSFVFELGTEDGQRSLFQATSQEEMDRWIKELVGSGTQIAFRRATFLAQTPLLEEQDHDFSEASPPTRLATIPAASKSRGVFGVPLWELVQREGSIIPHSIELALEYIEAKGLTEVGIYRISGENKLVNELKDSLNKGYPPSSLFSPDRNHDVHNITSLVKLFLRELPDPLIPHHFYDAFMKANMVEGYDERLYSIRDLVWKLPQPHFQLLRRLTEHLDKVTDNESINAMHGANLALVLAPTLLHPPPGAQAFAIAMTNLGKSANLIKSLILQEVWIFGQQEVEQEQEQEFEQEVLVEAEAEAEAEVKKEVKGEDAEVLDEEKIGGEEVVEELRIESIGLVELGGVEEVKGEVLEHQKEEDFNTATSNSAT